MVATTTSDLACSIEEAAPARTRARVALRDSRETRRISFASARRSFAASAATKRCVVSVRTSRLCGFVVPAGELAAEHCNAVSPRALSSQLYKLAEKDGGFGCVVAVEIAAARKVLAFNDESGVWNETRLKSSSPPLGTNFASRKASSRGLFSKCRA